MEFVVWLLLIFTIFFLPLILAIIALVKIGGLRREIRSLRSLMPAPPPPPVVDSTTPAPLSQALAETPPSPPPIQAEPRTPPAPPELPPSAPPLPAPVPVPAQGNAEIFLGGRIASFIGIALLLIGLGLLVGYAVRHSWFGPAARIASGLGCGVLLVLLGHAAEIRGRNRLTILARVLTGGGAATFYFSIFAAYGVYDLIGPGLTATALLMAAIMTFGLALAYRSQTVAMIGVVGAFGMPVLISADEPQIGFLLSYVATINLPVIMLGLRRHWQGLYNSAFIFTSLYQFLLLAGFNSSYAPWLLTFSPFYFLQFAVLGLVKLRSEQVENLRAMDLIRLLLNSLVLLVMISSTLEQWQQTGWMGLALIVIALLHLALVRVGWHWFPRFNHDLICLLMGALTFASLALPAQLDGVWISTGWSVMGAVVCWLAIRERIPVLREAALILGVIGLLKSLAFDWQIYDSAPTLFLNARFLSGLTCAILLAAQGYFHDKMSPPREEPAQPTPFGYWSRYLSAGAALAVWVVFITDIFWTVGFDDPWAWLLATAIWLIIAMACVWTGITQKGFAWMGSLLLAALPLMVFLSLMLLHAELSSSRVAPAFTNHLFGAWLGLVLVTGLLTTRSRTALLQVPGCGCSLTIWLRVSSALAAILLVTLELDHWGHAWAPALITLWWAVTSILLILWGLLRQQSAYRYVGLLGFAATTGKVLLVDLMALDGLVRIAAFMGVGILLLLLSFLYQHMVARLSQQDEKPTS